LIGQRLTECFRAAQPDARPAFILFVQTFGNLVTFQPHVHALVAEGRKQLARYMIRPPFALGKLQYIEASATVIYRTKMHATLKRNFQALPGAK